MAGKAHPTWKFIAGEIIEQNGGFSSKPSWLTSSKVSCFWAQVFIRQHFKLIFHGQTVKPSSNFTKRPLLRRGVRGKPNSNQFIHHFPFNFQSNLKVNQMRSHSWHKYPIDHYVSLILPLYFHIFSWSVSTSHYSWIIPLIGGWRVFPAFRTLSHKPTEPRFTQKHVTFPNVN